MANGCSEWTPDGERDDVEHSVRTSVDLALGRALVWHDRDCPVDVIAVIPRRAANAYAAEVELSGDLAMTEQATHQILVSALPLR